MNLHKNCIGCSEDGFIFKNLRKDSSREKYTTDLAMERHMEGWIGIPHGGIGMGALMELVAGLNNYPSNVKNLYPLSVTFKMGGAKAAVGSLVELNVRVTEGGANGEISVKEDPHPYITTSVVYNKDAPDLKNTFSKYLPESYDHMTDSIFQLPRYKNCFVCGTDRKDHGLKRHFELLSVSPSPIVISRAGFNEKDKNNFYWCRRDNTLHPLALLALLDETMGWGGFFLTGQGGVSVRFNFVFLRDIKLNEKIIVFGKGESQKGNINKRLMFWSSGGVAAVKEDNSLEIVAASSAQFFAVPELTEQMRVHLSPEHITEKAFEMAEA